MRIVPSKMASKFYQNFIKILGEVKRRESPYGQNAPRRESPYG